MTPQERAAQIVRDMRAQANAMATWALSWESSASEASSCATFGGMIRRWADQWEAIASALSELQHERDELKALANVGTWHDGRRPNREMAARELAKSQAVIDKLADRIQELEADISEPQRTTNDWQLIESAPKSVEVLVACGKARYVAYQTDQPPPLVNTWRHPNGQQLPIWPTHWMPLPPAPDTKGSDR